MADVASTAADLCPNCKGEGTVTRQVSVDDGYHEDYRNELIPTVAMDVEVRCGECGGEGVLSDE